VGVVTALDLLADSLAVYRVTRLVTTDVISESIRDRVVDRGGLLAEGVECDWCVGVWVATGAAVWKAVSPGSWEAVRWPLAVAAGAGVASTVVRRLVDS
jgi:hypothetical protein